MTVGVVTEVITAFTVHPKMPLSYKERRTGSNFVLISSNLLLMCIISNMKPSLSDWYPPAPRIYFLYFLFKLSLCLHQRFFFMSASSSQLEIVWHGCCWRTLNFEWASRLLKSNRALKVLTLEIKPLCMCSCHKKILFCSSYSLKRKNQYEITKYHFCNFSGK